MNKNANNIILLPDGHLMPSTVAVFHSGGFSVILNCNGIGNVKVTDDILANGSLRKISRNVEGIIIDEDGVQMPLPVIARPQTMVSNVKKLRDHGKRYPGLFICSMDTTIENIGKTFSLDSMGSFFSKLFSNTDLPKLNGRMKDISDLDMETMSSYLSSLREYAVHCVLPIKGNPSRLCFGIPKEKYGIKKDFITWNEFVELIKRKYSKKKPALLQTEFPFICSRYINEHGLDGYFEILDSAGKTENFLESGGDVILDTIETGSSRTSRGIATVLPGVMAAGSFLGVLKKDEEVLKSYPEFLKRIAIGLARAIVKYPKFFEDTLCFKLKDYIGWAKKNDPNFEQNYRTKRAKYDKKAKDYREFFGTMVKLGVMSDISYAERMRKDERLMRIFYMVKDELPKEVRKFFAPAFMNLENITLSGE